MFSTLGAFALVTISEQSNHRTDDDIDGHESEKLISREAGSADKVHHKGQVKQCEYDRKRQDKFIKHFGTILVVLQNVS